LTRRSTWPRTTCRFHRRPRARVARPHLRISDMVRCPDGCLLAVGRGRRFALAPSHCPKTPSRPSTPTHMGVTDQTQCRPQSQDPHGEPHSMRYGWPSHNPHECPMMVVGQSGRGGHASASTPGPDARYQIPVKVQGGMHQAVLDSVE